MKYELDIFSTCNEKSFEKEKQIRKIAIFLSISASSISARQNCSLFASPIYSQVKKSLPTHNCFFVGCSCLTNQKKT